MNSLSFNQAPFQSPHILSNLPSPRKFLIQTTGLHRFVLRTKHRVTTRCSNGGTESRRSFLTLEEAGLVEISGLSTHEKFLCRLTISSLNLLRVIAEQEGKTIEELDAGSLCDWFLKDRLKREQNVESAVLQWDDSEILL